MFSSKELGALSDRDLLAAARAYESAIRGDAASFNFTTADADAVKNLANPYEATLDQWDAVQLEEAGIAEAKAAERTGLLGELRRQRNVLYADTGVSENLLASAGLPPRDKTKTDAGAPKTAPIGWVDYGKLKHTIHFRDAATPDKKAKPDGVRGCEIWHFIGTAAPTNADDWNYLATDTNSPYIAFQDAADAGKKVFYQLRWLSNSGERGEWSETIEATING